MNQDIVTPTIEWEWDDCGKGHFVWIKYTQKDQYVHMNTSKEKLEKIVKQYIPRIPIRDW